MINDYGERFEGFNLILNAAERYHRPIFISTNLTEEQIYERYGDRTMDRLTHLCRTVHFSGDSLRK
jgi:DNA replication protein DnaC